MDPKALSKALKKLPKEGARAPLRESDEVKEGSPQHATVQSMAGGNGQPWSNPGSIRSDKGRTGGLLSGMRTPRRRAPGPLPHVARRRKKQEPVRWYHCIRTIRAKQILWFTLSQLVLIAMVTTNLVLLDHALLEVYTQASQDQIGLVDVTYKLKMNQMGLGFYGNSLNGYLSDFLSLDLGEQTNTSTTLYANVEQVLASELTSRQIEYSLLVNASGHIVATGNAERQRAFAESRFGEFFNPGGLMSRMLANKDDVGYQIKSSVVIPRSMVLAERPPVWRERPQAFLPSGDYHWADNEDHDCLVRFTLTAIHDGTLFLGVVVSGDVLNGKIPVAYHVVNVLDKQAGFVGVYVKDNDEGWIKSSLYFRSYRDTVSTKRGFVLDSADASPADDKILNRALAGGRGRLATYHDTNFVLAATPVPPGTIQGGATLPSFYNATDTAEAVIVRGFDLRVQTTFTNVRDVTLIAVGIVLFIEIIVFVLSLRYLVTPLEEMAYALKRGVRLDSSDFRKVHVGGIYAVGLFLSALPAMGCIIFVVLANTSAIDDAMLESAEGQAGAGAIAYQLKVDQMSYGFFGDANQLAIHNVLLSPDDATAVADATAIMGAEIYKRRIEFATVVDMTGKVVASPNADRRGEFFDPDGIVTRTRELLERQKWTEVITYAELAAEDPPVHQESLDPDAPESGLHPSATHRASIVRYTTTLVDADGDGRYDGMLVSGDVVSGKTAIPEAVLDVNDEGYEAVYVKHEHEWILCTSVERYRASDDLVVDVEFPYEGLLDKALRSGHVQSRFGTVNGKSYVFAATPLENSVSITASGEELPAGRTPVVVIVHGNPTTDGDEIKREQTTVIIVILVVQILTSVVGIYIAFDPMRRMKGVLQRYGFAKPTTGWKKWFGVFEDVDIASPRNSAAKVPSTTKTASTTSTASTSAAAPVTESKAGPDVEASAADHVRASTDSLTKLVTRYTETVRTSSWRTANHAQAGLPEPETSFEDIYPDAPEDTQSYSHDSVELIAPPLRSISGL